MMNTLKKIGAASVALALVAGAGSAATLNGGFREGQTRYSNYKNNIGDFGSITTADFGTLTNLGRDFSNSNGGAQHSATGDFEVYGYVASNAPKNTYADNFMIDFGSDTYRVTVHWGNYHAYGVHTKKFNLMDGTIKIGNNTTEVSAKPTDNSIYSYTLDLTGNVAFSFNVNDNPVFGSAVRKAKSKVINTEAEAMRYMVSGTKVVSQTPSPVPLPAGLPLLLAGLGSIAALRRRNKA